MLENAVAVTDLLVTGKPLPYIVLVKLGIDIRLLRTSAVLARRVVRIRWLIDNVESHLSGQKRSDAMFQ
jgi:hypothetical protein